MRLRTALLVGLLLVSTSGLAADLRSLQQIFEHNFEAFYQPAKCGQNIRRLLQEASRQRIDLSGAYVLKFVGAGFFETSGFYTRNRPDERVMLGYFHYVLVANGHVFDFDLKEPLVLPLEDYVRLQFSSSVEPLVVHGVKYDASQQLAYWTASRFDVQPYLSTAAPTPRWTGKLGDVVDIKKALGRRRVR